MAEMIQMVDQRFLYWVVTNRMDELREYAATLTTEQRAQCATYVLNHSYYFLQQNNRNDPVRIVETLIEMGGRPDQGLLNYLNHFKDVIDARGRHRYDALFIKNIDDLIELVNRFIKTRSFAFKTFKSSKSSKKKSVKKRKSSKKKKSVRKSKKSKSRK